MRKIVLITTCQNQLNIDARFVTSLINTINLLKKRRDWSRICFYRKNRYFRRP